MSLDYEEEIGKAIVGSNFIRSSQLAEEWLKKIPVDKVHSEEWGKARFAYLLTRFFLHRLERINSHNTAGEKARFFLSLLNDLENYLREVQEKMSHSLVLAARYYCHSQIAEGLAKEFAGQRSYNLNPEEITQLAISLIEIEKIPAAWEVLLFLYQMNPKSPRTLYLMSHVLYKKDQEKDALNFLRQALFYRPEVVLDFPQYLIKGKLYDLYQKVAQKEYPPTLKARHFALLAEIYGLYPSPVNLTQKELAKLKEDYLRLSRDYQNNLELRDELFPRLAHYLCWLIEANYQNHSFEAVEEWRQEMRELDQELWKTFSEHHHF